MAETTEENGRSGRLLVIGGAEDRTCGTGPLEEFVELAGARSARIVVVTTATQLPEEVTAEYTTVFRRLGVASVTELRLLGRATSDDETSLTMLRQATDVLFSGGDQSRIRTLVGSRTNVLLRRRLSRDGLVIAGTSAGATAMGRWMILGGRGHEVAASTVRIGPGLGLLDNVLIDMHFGERGRLPRLLSGIALDTRRLGVGIDEDTACDKMLAKRLLADAGLPVPEGRVVRPRRGGRGGRTTLPPDRRGRRPGRLRDRPAASGHRRAAARRRRGRRSFGSVVVYGDEDLRGRAPGEMTRLITGGLTRSRPDIRIRTAGDLKGAVGIALGAAAQGEPVLLLHERLQPVIDLLRTLGATPARPS